MAVCLDWDNSLLIGRGESFQHNASDVWIVTVTQTQVLAVAKRNEGAINTLGKEGVTTPS